MTVTGDEAIQFVWTTVGTGIDDFRGAVIISVATSANQIVSTELLASGGKELENDDVLMLIKPPPKNAADDKNPDSAGGDYLTSSKASDDRGSSP